MVANHLSRSQKRPLAADSLGSIPGIGPLGNGRPGAVRISFQKGDFPHHPQRNRGDIELEA
jgi:hypothetical protein